MKTMDLGNRVRILTVTLLLVSLSLACHAWLKDPQYTTKEPKRADFVGTWVPNLSTLKEMQRIGHYDAAVTTSLELRDNGTFSLSNMPDWWSTGEGKSHGQFDQYSGKWTISLGATELWELNLYSTKGIRLVNLFGQKPPYLMSFCIGDPDNDQAMIFEKQ